ncbi:hypothetical protein EU546_02210 [Candidatus Thorarchaeota archaeon]|nr:MAG: hypothetical protein EU546_02210 [Candidatus Thorarchaeota archaeon]
MKHAKTIITLTSVLVLAIVVATPLLTTPADAAAVLDSASAASANISESFSIVARGRAVATPTEDDTRRELYLTNMSLTFLIEAKGARGVILSVADGRISLNDSVFTFDEGHGFAARPESGDLNVTVVFGFRINFTGPEGEVAQLSLVGGVKRTWRFGPILIMRGQLTVGDSVFMLGQLGRIHRA